MDRIATLDPRTYEELCEGRSSLRLEERSVWILKVAAEVRDVGWPMVEATHNEDVTEWELAAIRLGVIECLAFFARQRAEAERQATEGQ